MNNSLQFHLLGDRPELQTEIYDECKIEMQKMFMIGSVNGQFIDGMKKLVKDLFPFAFNNQFQDPQMTNSISFDLDTQANHQQYTEQQKTNQHENYNSIDFKYISRPSDFRLKSSSMVVCESSKFEYDDKRNLNGKRNINKLQNGKTNHQPKPKSIRKLFDGFIVELNESIDGYANLLTLTILFKVGLFGHMRFHIPYTYICSLSEYSFLFFFVLPK